MRTLTGTPRGGPRRRDQAGRDHGRRGPAAGHRRFVWPGGVQRQPQNARDRHSHGARRGAGDVLRLVMGKGLVLVGLGTAIGLVMGLGVERLMNAMLFNAGGVDLVAYSSWCRRCSSRPCWRPTCPRDEHPGLRRHRRCGTSSESRRPGRKRRNRGGRAKSPRKSFSRSLRSRRFLLCSF